MIFVRFERQCGAFSPYPSEEVKDHPNLHPDHHLDQHPDLRLDHHPDHQVGDEPNLPTQHTVHARVVNFLPWIVPIVFGESSCKIAGLDNTATSPAEEGEPITDAP